MEVKSPCVIDTSHWEVIDWPNLDSRVMGVLFKLTQGRDYQDPTAESSWLGAKSRGLPRGPFHFIEPDDIAAQVENFLTEAERIKIIVSGKWMAEFPPVLDAEVYPHTETAVVGARLAGQYEAWMDMVREEVGVSPWIYSSKYFLQFIMSPIYWTRWVDKYGLIQHDWMTTVNSKPPAWAGTVPLWQCDVNHPDDPETVDGWSDWILHQYRQSAKGEIQGCADSIDLNVYHGTEEEFIYLFGGEIVEPPIGETMSISIGTVLAKDLNVRSTPNSSSPANIIGAAFLHAGDLVQFDKVEGFWARLKAARRAGKDLVLPGTERWSFLGETYGYIRPEWKIDAEEKPEAVVSLDLAGAKVDGAAYAPDHLEGTQVVFKKVQ